MSRKVQGMRGTVQGTVLVTAQGQTGETEFAIELSCIQIRLIGHSAVARVLLESDCIGHNYIALTFICHSYIGHSYIGHNC